jgi:hypothetical protein
VKGFGIVALIVGLAVGAFGLAMDTTVEGYGDRRVHNIGKMDERRTRLVISGVLVVVGVMLIGFGTLKSGATGQSSVSEDQRVCPYCAETVKAAAIVCRYCNRDLPSKEDLAAAAQAAAQRAAEEGEAEAKLRERVDGRKPQGLCPNCESTIPLDSVECKKCKARFDGSAAWKVKPLQTTKT